jgi:hypothetical protein
MWIEYDLKFKGEVHERGIFNSEHVKFFEIQQHGGGYGKAIELYYDGHDTKCIFIVDDDELINKVWQAIKTALACHPCEIPGVGFIRPLQRPFFNDETTLIPSAYEGEPL